MDGQTDVCMLLMRLPLEAPPRPRDQQHKAQRRLTALQWRADVVLGGALPIRWPMSLVRYSTYISLVCSLIAQSKPEREKTFDIDRVLDYVVAYPFRQNLWRVCGESHRRPDSGAPRPRGVVSHRDGPTVASPSAREIPRSDPTLISRREIHAQKPGTVFRRQYRF